jgi:aminoglycoside 3-N-acetyltransferase I
MPDTLEIHRLTGSSLDLMRQLNAVFAQAFADVDTYTRAPPDDAQLRDVLDRDHVVVLAASKGTQVVGGLVAYELPKLEQPRSELYLYDLAVAEAHRREGIATRLIAHLRTIAHARGAWVVFVQADHGDEPAIALYDRLGVREEVLHFDLPVP